MVQYCLAPSFGITQMLRISKLTDYGTLIMSQMASEPERIHSANELAVGLGLSIPTTSKVLQSLARHGLVSGVRGLRGGYSLSRSPHAISVADIVDALEDQPFGLTECSAGSGLCEIEDNCRIRVTWKTINAMVRRTLQEVSVASMVQPEATVQKVTLTPRIEQLTVAAPKPLRRPVGTTGTSRTGEGVAMKGRQKRTAVSGEITR